MPENQESRMIGYAMNLAEQQLRDGTASSQVITHYLKLEASRRERQEQLEILQLQKELIAAKTENLKSSKRMEEMFEEAMRAMTMYGGGVN
ncbi:MAG TPA: hypothetical protein DCR12_04800 [Lachnospiraceae bacterium]|nr:hypothetical protein [Lachnospiraceae bacterium]